MSADATRVRCRPVRALIGSAQHVGAPGNVRGVTANLKLTFHLDHSVGADHCTNSASCAGA